MPRLAIYLLPIAMDTILSSVMFLVTVRAAERGGSALDVGGLLAVWSASYMCTSAILAWIASRRFAPTFMIGACVGMVCTSLAFLAPLPMFGLYLVMVVQGISSASFFAPFQVFMKAVGEGGGHSASVSSGLYVWSWSTGFAIGPFVAGYLWQWAGWSVCHLLNGALAIVIAIAVWRLQHFARPAVRENSADEAVPPEEPEYSSMPDLAWMAWVFGGLGCMIVSLVRGAFPMSGEGYAISKAHQGDVFAVLSGVQALTGLALGRFRFWAYRPVPILLFGVAGVGGLVLFAIGHNAVTFALAAACLGLYCGSVYFYFVFHSLVHPERSARYVSINEAVVGLMGMVGPVTGGWMIAGAGLHRAYLACAGFTLMVALVQAAIHRHTLRTLRTARLFPVEQAASIAASPT